MDKGKAYKVFYDDGEKIKGKLLIFIKKDETFLIFSNPEKDNIESINKTNIIRMEEVKE